MAYQEDHLLAFDRAGKITASIVPAILGICPYTSRIEAWRRITGRAKPFEPNVHMLRGLDMESEALEGFEEHRGILVKEGRFIPHPRLDWLGASPDGITNENCPVEVKCPVEIHTCVPINYYAQVQTQIEVMDAPYGWFYSYVGNNVGTPFCVLRCKTWWDAAEPVLFDFYEKFILTDTPPPARLTKKEKDTWNQAIFHEYA